MKKYLLVVISMSLLVLMYSCSEVAPVQQGQSDATNLNLGKKSASNTSNVSNGSFLVISQGNSFPKNFAKTVST